MWTDLHNIGRVSPCQAGFNRIRTRLVETNQIVPCSVVIDNRTLRIIKNRFRDFQIGIRIIRIFKIDTEIINFTECYRTRTFDACHRRRHPTSNGCLLEHNRPRRVRKITIIPCCQYLINTAFCKT